MTYLTELTDGGNQIFKTDGRGRVRVPEQRREVLLDEFEKSGMSARAFAQLVGVHPTTFAAWHLRRRKSRDAGAVAARRSLAPVVRLVEAVTGSGPEDVARLQVELAGVARLEIQHASQVALAAELIAGVAGRTRKAGAC